MADDTPEGGRRPSLTNHQYQDSSLTSVTSVTDFVVGRPESGRTPAWIEERLRKAVAFSTALRSERLVAEIVTGREPEGIGAIGGIGVASAGTGADGVVAMAAEALSWLRWLDPDDVGIVRARLEGASWKIICWRFGISRPTADGRWRYALAIIAWRLNGNARSRRTPSLRSLLGMRRAA